VYVKQGNELTVATAFTVCLLSSPIYLSGDADARHEALAVFNMVK
jgi:hypothetical protein